MLSLDAVAASLAWADPWMVPWFTAWGVPVSQLEGLAFVLSVLMVGFNLAGLDLESSFGGAVATLTNLGPGLGSVAVTWAHAGDPAIWLGSLGMILGRLEVFSLLVLLTPAFWRE